MTERQIRDVIHKILVASGEEENISQSVISLLYSHLQATCRLWTESLLADQDFDSTNFSLATLVGLFKKDRVKLIRMARYLQILADRSDANNFLDDGSLSGESKIDFDNSSVSGTQEVEGSQNLSRKQEFLDICHRVGVDPPISGINYCCFDILRQLPNELAVGFRYRLLRTDHKCKRMSPGDYLSFARLRQSASLLCLSKRFRADVLAWIFSSAPDNIRLNISPFALIDIVVGFHSRIPIASKRSIYMYSSQAYPSLSVVFSSSGRRLFSNRCSSQFTLRKCNRLTGFIQPRSKNVLLSSLGYLSIFPSIRRCHSTAANLITANEEDKWRPYEDLAEIRKMSLPDMKPIWALSREPVISDFFLGRVPQELFEFPELTSKTKVLQLDGIFEHVLKTLLCGNIFGEISKYICG
ncbi:unnamed protein product [Protopolystoma xenopodis]|uniref:Uncharacterized protein n=1 Tax=Protopolystoma xenopodis TaxID=117903 RepID=A0A448WGC1_9PLAT|nr:unnamed protein product [Protopolystoma xenopodis]